MTSLNNTHKDEMTSLNNTHKDDIHILNESISTLNIEMT